MRLMLEQFLMKRIEKYPIAFTQCADLERRKKVRYARILLSAIHLHRQFCLYTTMVLVLVLIVWYRDEW